jgi:flagellin
VTGLGGQNLATVDLTTQAGAASALTTIKNTIGGVSNNRAAIGAGINRLQAAVAVLQTTSQNTQAAESGIRDANIAQEVGNLTKYQILAQSGIASLAQANSSSQLVLNLLNKL